jgi:hypothetical protein
VHGHVLRLEVLVDPFLASLTTKSRVLDPAEGGGGVGDQALVEADHAGLETLADPQGPFETLGIDVGDQAIDRVVGGGDRLVVMVEADDGGDGPKTSSRSSSAPAGTPARTVGS